MSSDNEKGANAGTEALRGLAKEAADTLAAFRAVTADIEQRLLARAEARAVEQSRVMQCYEDQCAAILLYRDADEKALDACSERLALLEPRVETMIDAIDAVRREASSATVACRQMESTAGDKFGRRLEALASQVVRLVTVGKRLTGIEAKIEKCLGSVAEFGVAVVAINENQRAQQHEIDALRDAVEAAQPKPPAGKGT